uniref:F-box protein n=1 Tax=Globodera rostochiensis TaxID=31243 RepID=A0A914HZL9_GLORO
MSDNISDEEQQQQMQKISICADVWLKVFAFVSRVELGLIMALISDRFDFLVDVHFNLSKWSLGSLQILRAIDGNDAEIAYKRSGELVSIPQGPLPSKVIGFERIEICYVDQTVIEFLQRIRRLFDSSGTSVEIGTSCNQCSLGIIWQKIWPLINDNIFHFSLFGDHLDHLRQFSPAILRNCAKLRSIDSCLLFFEFPAKDNADASSAQAVAKWMLAPREDGLPKMLDCYFNSTGLEGLKEAFVDASEPVNFIIKAILWNYEEVDADVVPFELKNYWTRERLTLERLNEFFWLLVRCPIAREEAKWAEWEEEALVLWNAQCNIFINFKDSAIGSGMFLAGRKCLIA